MFQVYTRFGRVLGTFPIGENETFHRAHKEAYQYLLEQEQQGITCWVRYIP